MANNLCAVSSSHKTASGYVGTGMARSSGRTCLCPVNASRRLVHPLDLQIAQTQAHNRGMIQNTLHAFGHVWPILDAKSPLAYWRFASPEHFSTNPFDSSICPWTIIVHGQMESSPFFTAYYMP